MSVNMKDIIIFVLETGFIMMSFFNQCSVFVICCIHTYGMMKTQHNSVYPLEE